MKNLLKKILILLLIIAPFSILKAQQYTQSYNSSTYIAIYPNPTTQPNFYVKTSEIITKIEVIDLAGNKIYTKDFYDTYSEIMRINLPTKTKKGLYLVKIFFDNHTSVIRKLIYK